MTMTSEAAFDACYRASTPSAWRVGTSHHTAFYFLFGDLPDRVRAQRPDLPESSGWTRVAGPGRRTSTYDDRWCRLARLTGTPGDGPGRSAPLRVGEPFSVGISFANPDDWWYSSPIARIESVDYDDLPVYPHRCPRCNVVLADWDQWACEPECAW